MTRRVRRDDRGVAALEVGILVSLLLLLAFGALPLYSMLAAKQKVSKASAATLRYATAVASNATRKPGGALSRRPTYDEIQSFARDAADDSDLDVTVTVCQGATCTDITADSPNHASPIPARAGDTVHLTVRTTVDMRVVGAVANAATSISGGGDVFPDGLLTVSSTASAREE
jgi:Flp pilus assembly protein TadG